MKDVPHHMSKFIKTHLKEESPKDDKCLEEFKRPLNEKQKKKQAKAKKRKSCIKKIPNIDTPEDKNKKMNERTPQIRERSHKTNLK